MTLMFFREAFVNRLLAGLRDNLKRYREDSPWVNDIQGGTTASLPTRVELKSPLELCTPDGEDLKDLENAIRIHKALPHLTRVQARDPRLWTRLSHVDHWEYMRERWPAEKYDDPIRAERVIRERYFIAQSQSRAFMRQGLSRLWWYASLTFDSARKNPYELTGVLLTNLDLTQTVLERNLGRAPAVLTGFLEFLLTNPHLLSGGEENRQLIRSLGKALNLFGGTTILDALSKADVMDVLADDLRRAKDALTPA